MTKATRDAIAAVRAWCDAKGIKLTSRPSHVFPRAYVVKVSHWTNVSGRRVPCLKIACPIIDAEPHMQRHDNHRPFTRVDGPDVDKSLKAGDWCVCAYICEVGNQRNVAVPLSLV